MFLLATKVTDRFGNTLSYSYNGRGNPTAIVAEDRNGEVRRMDLAYQGDRLTSASINARSWTYQYDGAGNLSAVTLPDGSAWQYSYAGNLKPGFDFWDGETSSTCGGGPDVLLANYEVVSRHPSGAQGKFNFTNLRHYRAGVQRSECVAKTSGQDLYYVLSTPNQIRCHVPGIEGTERAGHSTTAALDLRLHARASGALGRWPADAVSLSELPDHQGQYGQSTGWVPDRLRLRLPVCVE